MALVPTMFIVVIMATMTMVKHGYRRVQLIFCAIPLIMAGPPVVASSCQILTRSSLIAH